MDTRSRGWWIACTLLALAGCGSDMSGNDGRGMNGAKPIPGQPTAGAAGSASNPLTGVGNPTMPAPPPRTTPITPMMACASKSIVANRVLPTVMLVVDGSTSMEGGYGPIPGDAGMQQGPVFPGLPTPPAPGQASRWGAIREALVRPDVGVVPALQGLVHFGLALYGTQPMCPLPMGIVAPARNNFDAINRGLPNGRPPGMFTPTGPALDEVVKMLPDSRNVVDMIIGPQIIVLATDGDPNSCGDAQTNYMPSIAAAMAAQAKGIKMYVISVGQDAAATHLKEMANIGAGMPANANPGATVYYPEDPAALAETLKTLIGAELSCNL